MAVRGNINVARRIRIKGFSLVTASISARLASTRIQRTQRVSRQVGITDHQARRPRCC
jgi:hypothetical protein